jgi:ABC-type nitrate/sulfonate/bicarbonate transport system substrate-binding protein/outer membrane protein OmpA-like peptidoglycan-associated protein
MTRFIYVQYASLVLCFASGFAAATEVSFIEAVPLTKLVSSSVEACSSDKSVQVPLITWGGDISTIYANGNQTETAAGSIFDSLGLKLKLKRDDVFTSQIKSYLECKSPYLRGTLAMVQMASEVLAKDNRTKPIVIYQMTWSTGGDALVVKGNIKTPKDLKGKTIALQAYGPHVDYLGKILSDAELKITDVKIKWTKDLTGTEQTPVNALYKADIDAAFVIIPDALKLTSNGTVGTGAEDSVKGAKIMLSTKTASRIITDVYAVRSDYLTANKFEVLKFVKGLLKGQEELQTLFKAKGQKADEFKKMTASAAKILLDSEQALADVEGMYHDASFTGWGDNVKFFKDNKNPRGFSQLNSEIKQTLLGLNLISKAIEMQGPSWDFADLKKDLKNTAESVVPKFNLEKVSQVAGKSAGGELFSFEVKFKPNQNGFSASEYTDSFKKAVDLAATYAGAVMTIEGHTDPLGFLKKKKEGENQLVLSRIKQSAKNLSLTRANAVRDSLLQFAKNKGVSVDPSQFAIVGHGIEKPKTGLCGSDPCAPNTEAEWLSNMRVEFRMIQVEAEENVFQSL